MHQAVVKAPYVLNGSVSQVILSALTTLQIPSSIPPEWPHHDSPRVGYFTWLVGNTRNS